MIIVSGLPFSGTALIRQILKRGKLTELPLGEITANHNFSYINDFPENDKYTVIPSFFLKRLNDNHKIIFIERNLEECFFLMEKRMKKEPHKDSFRLHFYNIKSFLKSKYTIFLNYSRVIEKPLDELKEIKPLISNFEKVIKVVDDILYRNVLY